MKLNLKGKTVLVHWHHCILFFGVCVRVFGIFLLIVVPLFFCWMTVDILTNIYYGLICSSAVFVGAFASSFNLLHTNAISNTKDGDVYSSFTHNGVLSRVEELICAMLGNFELSEYRSNSTHPQLSVFFILIYVILLSVILVNMLVAKMGDTYAKISDEAEARWRLELARMVLSMERSMTEEERRIGENMYWITLDKKRYLQVEEEEEDFWIKAATKRKKGKEGEGGENTYDPITT